MRGNCIHFDTMEVIVAIIYEGPENAVNVFGLSLTPFNYDVKMLTVQYRSCFDVAYVYAEKGMSF